MGNDYGKLPELHLKFTIQPDTSGFELSVSRSRDAIYFSIIAMPKKSHLTIFAIQNFVQNTKKHT